MDISQLQELISLLIKNEIQAELRLIRPSKAYNGATKPINSNYPASLGNKIATGRLYNSINVYFEEAQKGEIEIIIEAAKEAQYVEDGRRPGKYPPLQAMLNWVQSKPALTNAELSIKQRAFLAGRSIAKYGIYPTPFIQNGLENAQQKMEYYFEQWAVEYFTDYIKNEKIKIKLV